MFHRLHWLAHLVATAISLASSAFAQDGWSESHREVGSRKSEFGTPEVPRSAFPLPTSSETSWQSAYHAAVRVNAGNSWGSGACFWIDGGSDSKDPCVYVLTNAHVVGRSTDVRCEFFHRGYKSSQLAGRVVATAYNNTVDAAIIAVPIRSFNGRLPHVLQIGADPRPGQPIVTIGCPRADWPALWQGHVVETAGGGTRVVFTPGSWPIGAGDMMSGRSGSSLLDETGTKIIGMVAWSDGRERGMAMPISLLLRQTGFTEPVASAPGSCPHGHVQWGGQGGGSCPLCPNGGNGGGGGNNGGGDAWPGLPPAQPTQPISPLGAGLDDDVKDLERRLRSLEADRAGFAGEWAEIKSAYRELKAQWPEIRAAVDASESATLKRLADQAEQLDAKFAKQLEALEEEFTEQTEEAAEESQEAQEKTLGLLAALKEKYVSIDGAIAGLSTIRDNGGIGGTVEAAKDAVTSEAFILGLARYLGPWASLAVGAYFFARRQKPLSRVVRTIRKIKGGEEEVEEVVSD